MFKQTGGDDNESVNQGILALIKCEILNTNIKRNI